MQLAQLVATSNPSLVNRRLGASDGRVTLIGDVKRCDKAEEEELGLRQIYKEI